MYYVYIGFYTVVIHGTEIIIQLNFLTHTIIIYAKIHISSFTKLVHEFGTSFNCP
jgi:hypothetical protein